jgi:major membrane immunogen (membrane-anchored lipoprotein)
MHSRLGALAAIMAALALVACGGDDDKKDEPAASDTTERTTSTAETQGDPAAKVQMQRAVGGYNRGYRKFFDELKNNGGDLERLKTSIGEYRTTIFDFDKDMRAIEFEDGYVAQVNSILENNRQLIAQLDAIGDASSFEEAQGLYEEFLTDRTPALKQINDLLDQL